MEDSSGSAARRTTASVVVLTALRAECEAVLGQIARPRTIQTLSRGTVYHRGRFEGDEIDWTVSVAEIGPGNENTASEATAAILELNPDLLMFVGVAGSLKHDEVGIGAVVVADVVHGYMSGKASAEFAPRPITYRTSWRLSQLVRLVQLNHWPDGEEIPVHLGALAAADIVVTSTESDVYRQIRRYQSDALAVEMESLGLYVAADHAGGPPALSVRGISDLVDGKTAKADIERQPRAAGNAARFAFALLKAMKITDLGVSSEDKRAAIDPTALDWASVPFSSAEWMQKAIEDHREEVVRLLSILSTVREEDPQGALDELVHATPQWLTDAKSNLLWGAIGEFALTHGLHAFAADAFDRAAQTGGDCTLWTGLSAIALELAGQHDQALERLSEATGESMELPAALTRAVIKADTEEILRLTAEADGTYLRPSAYRIQALLNEGRIPEAVDLAERSVARHPGAAGTALQLAMLLVTAARQDSSPIGYEASLLRARDLALTARDLRRAWGGDSVEAVIAAGRASILLGDAVTAHRIATQPPEGMAWPSEAGADPVRHIRVNALVLLQRAEDGLSDSTGFSNPITRKIAEADCLSALDRNDRAQALYVEAVDALAAGPLDDPEAAGLLFLGLSGLAQLGVTPIPHIARLSEVDSANAQRVEVLSAIATGETQRAIQAVRESGRSGDVPLLAIALVKAGQSDDAVSVLTDAANRFGRAEYRLEAVHILARAQKFDKAYDEAIAALAETPDGTPLKAKLRQTVIQLATMIPRWDAVVRQARIAISEGNRTEDLRWALVTGLNNTLSPEDALSEAASPPALKPRYEQEAQLLVSLHLNRGGGLDSIGAVLDIAEAFPGSEEVGAAAVGCVLLLSKDIKLPEGMRERLTRASDNFFDRFPDSAYLRRIQVTPERPVEVLHQLLAETAHHDFRAVEQVVERVRAGALPLAFLSHVVRRPYAELLVKGSMGWIIGESLDEEARERERGTAVSAIGHGVVVEASAVLGTIRSELPPGVLLGAFSHAAVAATSVMDAINSASGLSLRSTAFVGWDSLHASPIFEERTSEEADAWALDAKEIERILRSFSTKAVGSLEDESPELPLVKDPVRVASEMGLALYSDDVALRLLAANEGVSAFGTVSLLAAAQTCSLLSPARADGALDALRRHRYVDLSWSAEDLVRIAGQEQFSPSGGSCGALARAGFWSDSLGAMASYRSLLAHLVDADVSEEAITGWHASATYGLLDMVKPAFRADAAGELLASAFSVSGLRPLALPPLLAGARRSAFAQGATDPLPCFCRALSRVLLDLFGHAQGGRVYVEMMQQLTPADRVVALRELLGGTRTEGNVSDFDERSGG